MSRRETASIIVQIRGGLRAAGEADAVGDGMDRLGDQTRQAGEDAAGASVAFARLQRQLNGLARAEALASLASTGMTLALLGVRGAAIGLAVIALPALLVAFGQVGAAALIWSTALLAGMGGLVAGAGLMTLGVIGRFQQMKDVVGSAAYDLVGAVGQLKSTFLAVAASGADKIMRAIADALRLLLPVVQSLAPGLDAIAGATAGMFRTLGREVAGMGPELRAFLAAVPGAIRSVGEFAGSALKLFLGLATVGLPLAARALDAVAGLMRDIAGWFSPKRYQGAVGTLRSFATAVGTFFSAAAAPLKGVLGPGIREFGKSAMSSLRPLGLIVGTILATFVQIGRAALPAVTTAMRIVAGLIARIGPSLKSINIASIGRFLAAGVRGIAGVLAVVIPQLIKFGGQLLAALKPAEPLVTNVIWPLAKGIGEGLLGAIKSLLPVIKVVATVLGWLGTKAKPLRGVFETLGKVIGFLAAGPILKGIAIGFGAIAEGFEGAGRAGKLLGAVFGILGKGAEALGKVFQGIGWVIGKFGSLLAEIGRTAVSTARYLTYFADMLQGGVRGAVRIYATVLTRIVDFYISIPSRVAGVIGKLPGLLGSIGGRLYNAGKGLGGHIKDGLLFAFKAMVRGIATVWNNTAGRLHFKIPGWVPGVGGKNFGIPKISLDGLATGGVVMTAGSVWVGERGPELLNLPAGARVSTAGQVAATVRHTPIRVPAGATARATDGTPPSRTSRPVREIVLKVGARELARVVDDVHDDDDGRNS